jgi:hypothetical protein
MRINALLSSGASADVQLRLKPGDIIQGRVLETLADGKWVVRFRGLNLIAESALPLAKGSSFQARVLHIQDTIALQLLPAGTPTQATRVSAAEMLTGLGFTATEDNIALLQALLQRGWSPSLLSQLLPYQEALPRQNPTIILLAWQMGLPPHPHLLHSLQTLTDPHMPLGQLLGKLAEALQHLHDQSPSQTLEGQIQALQRWIPSSPNDVLPQWLYQLNTSYEASLLRKKGVHHIAENLKLLLFAIEAHLSELPDHETNQASPLVRSLLQHLDAHLLVNQTSLDELPLFYFQIPYMLDGHTGTIAFKGERKPPQSDEEETAFQLSFVAHTVHLGTLKVVLILSGHKVSCDLFAEDAQARDFVQQHQQELYESLQALEYQVERIRCAIASPEMLALEVVRNVPTLLQNWVSLDIRV